MTTPAFQLKPLSRQGIQAALDKAMRYRLLNEPGEAESICLDVLQLDPENQHALVLLLLAVTDRFGRGYAVGVTKAQEILPRLREEYDRAYYAGIIAERRELSADGHELTLAVNHLSHFLLTIRLLPLVRRSAPARIVNVSSMGQAAIDFDDPMLERRYDAFLAYAQSKLAQVMFTFELATRLRDEGEDGVTVNAVHPATLMDTKMVREAFGRARSTVGEGVEAVVRLAVSDEVVGVSGRFFDGKCEAGVDRQALDPGARRRLWELSERLTR
jgi:NAD(P)-dependent dehydrogenase (short-subunit alcohol dehydrogenase family)